MAPTEHMRENRQEVTGELPLLSAVRQPVSLVRNPQQRSSNDSFYHLGRITYKDPIETIEDELAKGSCRIPNGHLYAIHQAFTINPLDQKKEEERINAILYGFCGTDSERDRAESVERYYSYAADVRANMCDDTYRRQQELQHAANKATAEHHKRHMQEIYGADYERAFKGIEITHNSCRFVPDKAPSLSGLSDGGTLKLKPSPDLPDSHFMRGLYNPEQSSFAELAGVYGFGIAPDKPAKASGPSGKTAPTKASVSILNPKPGTLFPNNAQLVADPTIPASNDVSFASVVSQGAANESLFSQESIFRIPGPSPRPR